MKRYALFAHPPYEAVGGWFDFVDSFDSVRDAAHAAQKMPENFRQIIDLHTGADVTPNSVLQPPS